MLAIANNGTAIDVVMVLVMEAQSQEMNRLSLFTKMKMAPFRQLLTRERPVLATVMVATIAIRLPISKFGKMIRG